MKKLWLLLFVLLPVVGVGQTITTFAGGGATLGDGGSATAALINNPAGIVFSKTGELYIASGSSLRIRKISTSGLITTIAGNGTSGYSGDNGPATTASVKFPEGIALDTAENIFFSDALNHAVRKVNKATGVITTICGTGTAGSSGDGGPASVAQLYAPQGLCFDKDGNLYIADGTNHKIRKINTSGTITTICGTGTYGFSGDGGSAATAQLYYPIDVLVDGSGNIYISDQGNARIRKISPGGIITTLAGIGGTGAYIGDNIPATSAGFAPSYIEMNSKNELYIAGGLRVYKIDNAGTFHVVAGRGVTTNDGDGGPATAAGIHNASGIALDSCDNLYIGNTSYNRIRMVTFNLAPCDYLTVNEQKTEPQFSIYPNPATTSLTISTPNKIKQVGVYNLFGQSIYTPMLQTAPAFQVDIAQLPPGMYMVRVEGEDGGVVVKRFVKE